MGGSGGGVGVCNNVHLQSLASYKSRTCYVSCTRDDATLRPVNYMHLPLSYVKQMSSVMYKR